MARIFIIIFQNLQNLWVVLRKDEYKWRSRLQGKVKREMYVANKKKDPRDKGGIGWLGVRRRCVFAV